MRRNKTVRIFWLIVGSIMILAMIGFTIAPAFYY